MEYMHRSWNAKGKKRIVLYKDAGNNRVLFISKSALSNHNETLLSLFSGSMTASCTEQLFVLVSLCDDYEHNKDDGAFKAAVLILLKLFGVKRPFDTTQVKKDLMNFPAEVWNQHNREVIMYCFFKRCYDDEQFNQCLYLARRFSFFFHRGARARRRSWWSACMPKDDNLRAFLAKVDAAYAAEAMADGIAPNIVQICRRMQAANEGQNRFSEMAGPFLSFLKDFSDYNDRDLHFVCKQMGLTPHPSPGRRPAWKCSLRR